MYPGRTKAYVEPVVGEVVMMVLLFFEESDPACDAAGVSRERCVLIGCSGPAHPPVRHGLTWVDRVKESGVVYLLRAHLPMIGRSLRQKRLFMRSILE